MPRLSDYLKVELGYKSLMNDFFYLDQATIDTWSIEKRFLKPIMTIRDLDGTKYYQPTSGAIQLFYCDVEPGDLRGTGADRYMQWAARQETGAKKQSGAPVTWEEALAKQGGKYWWRPKAAYKPIKLAMRKGIDVFHAPFVFKKSVVVDQRCYTLKPEDKVDEGLITAYLCSSLFALALEVNADIGMGAGVLSLSTGGLQDLPTPDLTKEYNAGDLADLAKALQALLATEPPSALDDPPLKAITELDTQLMKTLGLSHLDVADVRKELRRLATSRKTLAAQRRSFRIASAELDVQAVAQGIFDKLKAWLSSRQFPEDFQSGEGLMHVTLPSAAMSVETFVMMGECQVTITQADSARPVLLAAGYDMYTAEMVLRALQMGRRDFYVVTDHERAMAALNEFENFMEELQTRLDTAIMETGVGPRWEGEIRRRVLDQAGLDLRELRRPFDSRGHWPIAPA